MPRDPLWLLVYVVVFLVVVWAVVQIVGAIA